MISFPYNANIAGYDDDGMPIFDRAIDALTQRQLTKLFYTNGVHADNNGKNNFRVNAGTGMTVVVDPGSCCIEGVYGIEDDQRTLAIQAADSMDRIDRVVIRLNDAERKIDLYVLKGTPASVPAAPELTRPISGESGDIYELGIADVFISKNTATIVQDRITDTRLNASLCGIIGTPNTVIDASSYYTHFRRHTELYSGGSRLGGTCPMHAQCRIAGGSNDRIRKAVANGRCHLCRAASAAAGTKRGSFSAAPAD